MDTAMMTQTILAAALGLGLWAIATGFAKAAQARLRSAVRADRKR